MILIVDNFDSFTWNLVAQVRKTGMPVWVERNDAVTLEEIYQRNISGIVLSPGPGRPSSAGVSVAIVKEFSGKIPILGICLGHQLIGEIYGGNVVHAEAPMHGKTSMIRHCETGIFEGISNPMKAMRYHSLLLEKGSIEEIFFITSTSEKNEIMGIRHKIFNLEGVQFHPESILTEDGDTMIRNWIRGIVPDKADLQSTWR